MIATFFSRSYLPLRLFLVVFITFATAIAIVLVNFKHDYLFEFELELEQTLGNLTRLQDKSKADEYAVLQDYLLYRMATKKMGMQEPQKNIWLTELLPDGGKP